MESDPSSTEQTSGTNKAVPQLFYKVEDAYKAMHDNATERHEGLVYEGSLTTLLETECSITTSTYSHVMQKLRVMGSVRQLARGGGGKGSLWLLVSPPSLEAFQTTPRTIKGMKSRDPYGYSQKMNDMSRRITTLERQVEYLMGRLKKDD